MGFIRESLSTGTKIVVFCENKILSSIINEYGVEKDTAERLYRHLWIYSHGIATLCVTGMCRFTGEEISTMMTEVFTGLMKNAKGERHHD